MKEFDWEALLGRNVLGCNAAFYMGSTLVPNTIFGDSKFLSQHLAGLTRYVGEGGIVVTNSTRRYRPPPPPWLRTMKKELHGLSKEALGWNGNTGASAINLALLLGASPIYLLGYDMQLSKEGEGNFHTAYSHTPKAHVYNRFLTGMVHLVRDLPKLFPGQQVINLEDGTSLLSVFPKESLREHFAERVVEV